MKENRIHLGLQYFADGAEGAPEAKPQEQNIENQQKSFDDILSEKEYQSEFDKRVSKALETARGKWEKETEDKISEAKKLEKMNAEQKAEYERKQADEKLAKRESDITRRELMAEAKETLVEKGLPKELAEVLSYDSADSCKKSLDAVEKAFNKAVETAVNSKLKQSPPKKGGANPGDTKRTGKTYF